MFKSRIKSLKVMLSCLAVAFVVGCSSLGGGSSSPAQAVFQAKQNYATALNVAIAYKRLPICNEFTTVLCSKLTVVAQIQKADEAAFALLNGAETAVRTGATGSALAVTAAQQAVLALTTVLKLVSDNP